MQAFELYVMEKSTLKQSQKWFALSDADRRPFFELELQRNAVVETQRQAIDAMLKRKQGSRIAVLCLLS